jgi:arylsulfatase A-like enzyme
MKRLILIFILVVIGLSVVWFAFRDRGPDNIFLITLDTMRGDHFNHDHQGNRITPHLASLASTGMYFENAYSLIPITLPAHMSMFHSLPPHRCGIFNNGQSRDVPFPHLVSMLKRKGYWSGAVISLGVLGAQYGMKRGFDHFVEEFTQGVWYRTAAEVNRDLFPLIKKLKGKRAFFWVHYSDPHEPYFPPPFQGHTNIVFNNQLLARVKVQKQRFHQYRLILQPGRNSLWFKTQVQDSIAGVRINGVSNSLIRFQVDSGEGEMEVKIPQSWQRQQKNGSVRYTSLRKNGRLALINPSAEPKTIHLSFLLKVTVHPTEARRELYRQEVCFMDEQLGRLVQYIKSNNMYERTTFIIIGDHGEGLGEYRDNFGHIHYLNNIYTRVPLILAGYGIKAMGKRKELASILDIAPTVLDVVGLKQPGTMQGRSLRKKLAPRPLFFETFSPEARSDGFSLLQYPHQLIYYSERQQDVFELYDLEKDPIGVTNLVELPEYADVKGKLMEGLMHQARSRLKFKKNIGHISEESRKMLRTLGYL